MARLDPPAGGWFINPRIFTGSPRPAPEVPMSACRTPVRLVLTLVLVFARRLIWQMFA